MDVRKMDEFAISFVIWYKNYPYKGFKTDKELLQIFKQEKSYECISSVKEKK
jgi:hypothetical protein